MFKLVFRERAPFAAITPELGIKCGIAVDNLYTNGLVIPKLERVLISPSTTTVSPAPSVTGSGKLPAVNSCTSSIPEPNPLLLIYFKSELLIMQYSMYTSHQIGRAHV